LDKLTFLGANSQTKCNTAEVEEKEKEEFKRGQRATGTNRALLDLMARHPGRMRTITADNGQSSTGRARRKQSARSSLLRHPASQLGAGINENTNGLIPPYLSKGETMARLSQTQCDLIAKHLNNRPRKTWLQNTQSILPSDLANVALQI
jgi:IS30 family transposase